MTSIANLFQKKHKDFSFKKILKTSIFSILMGVSATSFSPAPCVADKEKNRVVIHAQYQRSTPLAICASGKLQESIERDLGCCGAFKLLPPPHANPEAAFLRPPLLQYQGMPNAVVAVVKLISGTKAAVRVFSANPRQMLSQENISVSCPEQLGHAVSNAIYKAITQEEGFFDKKILYDRVSMKKGGRRGNQITRCTLPAIMDILGTNDHVITPAQPQGCTARIRGKTLAYIAKKNNGTRELYVRKDGGRDVKIPLPAHFGTGGDPSATICDLMLVSPDIALLSLAHGDSTHIWRCALNNDAYSRWSQITKGNSINVSPAYSPKTGEMIFVSSRYGAGAKLLKVGAGGGIQLLSKISGQYYAPTFSPNGERIAFIRQAGQGFYLGIMNADGTDQRMILDGYLMDSPTWLNNRTIMMSYYRSRKAQPTLCIVDIGSNSTPYKIQKTYGMDMPHCIDVQKTW